MIRTKGLHEFNWMWAFIECVHPKEMIHLKEQCTSWGIPLEHFPSHKRSIEENHLSLISIKYDLNKIDERGRNFLLFYLEFSVFQENSVFQKISSQTKNWNVTGFNKNTIAHKIVARYETKKENWLAFAIERGADINSKNAFNRTALDDALMYKNEKAIQLLLAHGATWGHHDQQGGHTLSNMLFFSQPKKENLIFWNKIDPNDNTPLVNDPQGTGGMLNSAIERELWEWAEYIVLRVQERTAQGKQEPQQLAGLKIALKQFKKQQVQRNDLIMTIKELILRTQLPVEIPNPPKIKI